MQSTETDWDLLNRYADNALPADSARALERRLGEDAGLRSELERIRTLKTQLGGLRPKASSEPVAAPRRFPRSIAAGIAALVLVICLAAGIGVDWRGDSNWLAGAEALHNRFAEKTYLVETDQTMPVVSTRHSLLEFQAPDLSASRLSLVDTWVSGPEERDSIALHYRGMRGCQLTIVAAAAVDGDTKPNIESSPSMLVHFWTMDGFHFAVIAAGMDANRFTSIADYTREAVASSSQSLARMRTAMADRYDTALPCTPV